MEITTLLLIVIGGMFITVGIGVSLFVYRNMNYDRNEKKIMANVGFSEKQVVTNDGTIMNYGEGPDNGFPLLLIHGHMASWENYAKVLPELSKRYHIYALDCHGHGKSSKNPETYFAEVMGKDIAWFIKTIVKQPVYISGHSLGGLLTVWVAANFSENVRGIIIEDSPFFATEPVRCEKTFAWVDRFSIIHRFLNQEEESNIFRFYLNNSYLVNFFGDSWKFVKNYAFRYLAKHPDKRLRIFFLPPSVNKTFDLLGGDSDLRFSDSFYDCSFFRNYKQAETLAKVKCPSLLIHANWKYDENGVLLGAMDASDAQKVHELLPGNRLVRTKSGHNLHDENPALFNRIVINFLDNISIENKNK